MKNQDDNLILVNLIKGETTNQVAEKCKDFSNFFESLPEEIKSFQQKYILDYASFNTRYIMLCIGTIQLASFTCRGSFTRYTRNLGLSFFGGGLFFIPETLNPYLFFKK